MSKDVIKKQEEENVNKTNRGFSIYNFKDSYGHMCSIQKSSSASQDKIWFGMDNPEIIVEEKASKYPHPSMGTVTNSRMLLTQEQVKKLLPILQKFVDTGDL